MPRIAAAIGVVATIAVFIFINIKSYPAVWEMAGTAPWFAQYEESSPQEISPQPEMVAEKDVKETAPPWPTPSRQTPSRQTPSRPTPSRPTPSRPELKSLAGSKTLDSDNPSKPAGFGPRLDPGQKSATEAKQSRADGTTAYRGLNLGPIKVAETVPEAVAADNKTAENTAAPLPAPSDARWPAEMSTRMKYAAKPPILETYQNWNPERPLVPVKQSKETKKPGNDKQDKSPKDARPDPKDSSCSKRPVEQGKGTGKAVVRHLPPVAPKNRPIRMSIPARGPNSPIPVYPGTGR